MSPLKIVILEDDSEDAEIIQDYVTRKKPDCEFTIAHSKEDFVDILIQFQPDIILSDHSMPRFSSTEALTMARSIYPMIPFIVVAGIRRIRNRDYETWCRRLYFKGKVTDPPRCH